MAKDPIDLAREIVTKVSKIEFTRVGFKPGEYNNRIDALVQTAIQEATRVARANKELDQKGINSRTLEANNIQELLREVKHNASKLSKGYQVALDERKQLARIENGQGLRRVFWRAASTASVAAVILFAWWFAHKHGIPLPLMRLPMPTPTP